jgi:primosomal replication protein N
MKKDSIETAILKCEDIIKNAIQESFSDLENMDDRMGNQVILFTRSIIAGTVVQIIGRISEANSSALHSNIGLHFQDVLKNVDSYIKYMFKKED